MSGSEEPWQRYNKERLHSGYTYPLRQQELRAALVRHDVQVGSLVLGNALEAAWRAGESVRVMSAHRFADDVARKWGSAEFASAVQTTLTLNACPTEERQRVRHLLLDEVLPAAAAWLRLTAGRGTAWQASEHEWEALLSPTGLLFAEDRFRH